MDRRNSTLYRNGEKGDQDIRWSQNATLADSVRNNVGIHLFEVIDAGEYIYCGRVELASKPYLDMQPDEDGKDRKVWIFPLRMISGVNEKNLLCMYLRTWKNIKSVAMILIAEKNRV